MGRDHGRRGHRVRPGLPSAHVAVNGLGRHTPWRGSRSICWHRSCTAGTRTPPTPGCASTRPVHWDEVNELWGISRYDDIVEIEKRKDVFINSDQDQGRLPARTSRPTRRSSASTTRRTPSAATWSPAASPRGAARPGRTTIRARSSPPARRVVAAKGGTAEIVDELAAPLPAMMIGKLLGFDEDDWPKLQRLVGAHHRPRRRAPLLQRGRHDRGDGVRPGAAPSCTTPKQELPDGRRDDAVHDGRDRRLPAGRAEVIADALLLLDGGAETTRTVIARTLLNLIDAPRPVEQLRRTAPTSTVAVEEFIRYVTPIHNMCRVADDRRRGRRRRPSRPATRSC